MNVEMLPVQIVGLKTDLPAVAQTLRRLGCLHITELAEMPEVTARPFHPDREIMQQQEEYAYLLARLEGLISALSGSKAPPPVQTQEESLEKIHRGVDELAPVVQRLTSRQEELQARMAMLPRYETTLRKLLPIIPLSAYDAGNISIGVLTSRVDVNVLDAIAKRIFELTNGRAEVIARDVDLYTRGMFIVFPEKFTEEIETLIGREDVSRLRLPADLNEGPPDVVLASLHRQMTAIAQETRRIFQELSELAASWLPRLVAWRETLKDRVEANRVLSRFGETDLTFVLAGWIPKAELKKVQDALQVEIGEAIFTHVLPLTPEMKPRAPVLLHNPPPSRPFESLVNLLALPRYGHIDPTRLMALFLPIFFGMMLGDIGYGVMLLAISLSVVRKFKKGVLRDVLIVLALGSVWAIFFGFLFGEAFGTLGEQFGLHPLWFERTSPEYITSLLVMTVAIGAAHTLLGLVLGIWEGVKDRSRSQLLERGGMLVGLIGLFLLVGVLAEYLPGGLRSISIAGIITGIVLLGASHGWLGILMGPIEFIGLIGNILSYLRIAAIGLASVYLAKVANDVAGLVGNLIVGIILAVLIHSLNLVLGAFSPSIHSLRLHYVEFFRKFYEGGGRPYQPYRSRLRG
jgi:V/A-type H+/Na+-transporting ATPase subunit I